MATYPSAIKTFSAIVNGVTKLVAALFNTPYDEITAIQTELGTNPKGTFADVKTRLDDEGIVQTVNTQTGAVATGTTGMPYDDTIPQITEGNEYMTLAITPKDATNKLKIDVVWIGSVSAAEYVGVALFQDTTANALAAAQSVNAGAGFTICVKFTHYMTAGTTSATTFRVRAGGVGNTTTFNGSAGGRIYGGVMASSISIQEIKV